MRNVSAMPSIATIQLRPHCYPDILWQAKLTSISSGVTSRITAKGTLQNKHCLRHHPKVDDQGRFSLLMCLEDVFHAKRLAMETPLSEAGGTT